MERHSKAHVFKVDSKCNSVQWCDLEKWLRLDQQDSSIISETINSWVYSWMGEVQWEEMSLRFRTDRLWSGCHLFLLLFHLHLLFFFYFLLFSVSVYLSLSASLSVSLCLSHLLFLSSFLSATETLWSEPLCSTAPFCHYFLPYRINRAKDRGIKSLRLWTKINLFLSKPLFP